MFKLDLAKLSVLDGFIAAALVDLTSGTTLATYGNGFDLELAAAGNTEVVNCKLEVMQALKLDDQIEDILITLVSQYHLIRLLESSNDLFLYLVLERSGSNLAFARHILKALEEDILDFS